MMARNVPETDTEFAKDLEEAKSWSLDQAITHLSKFYSRIEITKELALTMKGDEDPFQSIAWGIVARDMKAAVQEVAPKISKKQQRRSLVEMRDNT